MSNKIKMKQPFVHKRHLFCMEVMVRIVFISIFLLCSIGANAQAVLRFDKKIHDFGIVKEDQEISCMFILENTGKDTLIIGEVQPECGCTTPVLTSKRIAPNEKSVMKINYDGKDRIGTFSKKIAVYSNSNPKVEMLMIMGEIQNAGTFNNSFQKASAGLQLSTDRLVFGEVNNQSSKTLDLLLFNAGKAPIEINGFVNLPSWISADVDTTKIEPGATLTIKFTLDAKMVKDYGKAIKYFYIRTNDAIMPAKTLFAGAIVTEYFEPAPTNRKKLEKYVTKQPKAAFSRKFIDMGNVRSGAIGTDTFTVTNTGGDTLFIRKYVADCACFTINIPKYAIAPGETVVLTARFDGISRKDTQHKSATMYVNDPFAPEIVIAMVAQMKL